MATDRTAAAMENLGPHNVNLFMAGLKALGGAGLDATSVSGTVGSGDAIKQT